jgi:hypothetical protein
MHGGRRYLARGFVSVLNLTQIRLLIYVEQESASKTSLASIALLRSSGMTSKCE